MTDERPVAGHERIEDPHDARNPKHARIDDRRQQPYEIPVAHQALPLCLTAETQEAAPVTHEPDPAGELVAKPALAECEQEHDDLGREEQRRKHEKRARREAGAEEHDPVSLHEVALLPVLLEVVVVVDVGVRGADDAAPGHLHAPAKLDVLLIEEELVVEAAELVEGGGAECHRCATRCGDVGLLGVRVDSVGRGAVLAGPAEPADMDDGPGGVQMLRIVEEAQSGSDDANLVVLEGLDHPPEGARCDDGVGIEEDEGLAVRDLCAEIAAAPEAEVRRRADEGDATGGGNGLELFSAGSVVDDDHFPVGLIGPDGGHTGEEAGAGVVRDDHDRCGIPHSG